MRRRGRPDHHRIHTDGNSTTAQAQSPPDAAELLGATLTSATAGEPGVVVQAVQPDSKSRLKLQRAFGTAI
jgi:hypothetical protein